MIFSMDKQQFNFNRVHIKCAIHLSAIYSLYFRAGSLLFIRDKLWHYTAERSFYTSELEQLRKDARELEHFRFEFNVQLNP